MNDYADFISRKATANIPAGFEPSELGSFLFDFQAALVEGRDHPAELLARGAAFPVAGVGRLHRRVGDGVVSPEVAVLLSAER